MCGNTVGAGKQDFFTHQAQNILAANTSSEQLFSAAGRTVEDRCCQLKSETTFVFARTREVGLA